MMNLVISKELDKNAKQYINDGLFKFNLMHFPKDLGGRYEDIGLFIKDENGNVHGGITAAICWN